MAWFYSMAAKEGTESGALGDGWMPVVDDDDMWRILS